MRSARGLPPEFPGAFAVRVVHRLGEAAGQQRADDVAAFGRQHAGLHAHPGHPDRRRRLLDRARPDVDLAVVEELALPRERPVMGRQRLQDQVVRLPVPPHQPRRVGIGGRDLIRRALDQPHLDPPARQHVEPRHLLGHAHRVGAVGDRVAQAQQPRLLRLTRDHRQRHGHRDGHAGRGAVVLVDHDVEPDLIAQGEFVEVAVQQPPGLLRVELLVRQHDPQGAAFQAFFPGRVVGHLGEIPCAHGGAPGVRGWR